MKNSSPFVVDHKPPVQRAKRSGGHDEEVHRRDGAPLILKKWTPALLLAWVGRLLGEIARDGYEASGESALSKRGMDFPRAPTIRPREAMDERLYFRRDAWPPGAALRDPSPIEPEAFAKHAYPRRDASGPPSRASR